MFTKSWMAKWILFHNKWLFSSLLVAIGLFVGDIWLGLGILSSFAFVLLFNWFDLTGFRNIIKDSTEPYLQVESAIIKIEMTYRILLHTFEVLLMAVVVLLQGWEYMLLGQLMHYTGLTDLLYYWIGGYKLPDCWWWMNHTPASVFYETDIKTGYKYIPNDVIMLQIALGLWLTLSTYFVFLH